MITYVSGFFLRDSAKHTIDAYRCYFEALASTNIPIVLFLDEQLDWTFTPNVYVISISKNDLWTFQNVPETCNLPHHRDTCDTLDYMKMMNAKSDLVFIAKHLNLFQTQWFAWIDFGIVHVFRDTEQTLRRITELTPPFVPCMKTAGIWQHIPENVFERICWRFAGGFFLIHESLVDKFHDAVRETIQKNLPNFAWEVNVWAELERTGFDLGWYPANHDDSIIPFTPSIHQ